MRYANLFIRLTALAWIVTLVTAWTTAHPALQAAFETYTNARFGYCIAYPADFVPQGESDNGDGQVFTHPDGTVLRAWGGYNVFQETPATALRAELRRCAQDRRQVTYRRVGKNFFVVSGYEADGQRIFYLKKLVRSDVQSGFELVYPVMCRARYDREVVTIANSLRPRAPN